MLMAQQATKCRRGRSRSRLGGFDRVPADEPSGDRTAEQDRDGVMAAVRDKATVTDTLVRAPSVGGSAFLILGAGSHMFDVSGLAQRSRGIDTTATWTCEAFASTMRTVLADGLLRRRP
jgi:hypothetical protein